jgi:hypothetical protein
MKLVSFAEQTTVIAEEQKEYAPMYAHIDTSTPRCETTVCWELTPEEIAEVQRTGKNLAPNLDLRPADATSAPPRGQTGAALPRITLMGRPVHWRCFHCNATFTKEQEKWALEHFGNDCGAKPVCLMRSPGEDGLIAALRKAETQLTQYRAEDSDVLRAMAQMQSDHGQALRRAEEEGYDKGLCDRAVT